MNGAAAPEPCDHHWISTHQSDFPLGMHWLRQCSQCGRIDGGDLRVQMDKAAQAVAPPTWRVEREPECDMTDDGKHTDGGVDPDWNEQICGACHEVIEP